MTDKLHISPEDEFPEDLTKVADKDLQVLDSQVQRQLDYEYISEGSRIRRRNSGTMTLMRSSKSGTNGKPDPPGHHPLRVGCSARTPAT